MSFCESVGLVLEEVKINRGRGGVMPRGTRNAGGELLLLGGLAATGVDRLLRQRAVELSLRLRRAATLLDVLSRQAARVPGTLRGGERGEGHEDDQQKTKRSLHSVASFRRKYSPRQLVIVVHADPTNRLSVQRFAVSISGPL